MDGQEYFTLQSLEVFLGPRAVMLQMLSPLEPHFITIYFIPAARVITMVIVEFLIIESQIFINIRCGYYWQTQCQFLKKYGNFVIWGDSLFIIFLILMNMRHSYSLKIKQQKYPSNHFSFDWSAPLAKDPRRAPGSPLILLVRTSSH